MFQVEATASPEEWECVWHVLRQQGGCGQEGMSKGEELEEGDLGLWSRRHRDGPICHSKDKDSVPDVLQSPWRTDSRGQCDLMSCFRGWLWLWFSSWQGWKPGDQLGEDGGSCGSEEWPIWEFTLYGGQMPFAFNLSLGSRALANRGPDSSLASFRSPGKSGNF